MLTKNLKIITLISITSLLITFSACSFSKKNVQVVPTLTPTPIATPTPTPIPLINDTELTLKLKNEKDVKSCKVYTQGEFAFAAITVNDKVSKDKANVLAQSYAKKIKEKYKDKKANVQVVNGSKNLANVTLN